MKRTAMMMAAAVAVIGATVPASAMQNNDVVTVSRTTPNRNLDKARELRAQAEALFSQPRQWRKAVRLLEESARLREASDPDAYMCLLYAGRIEAALGDLAGARENLEKAAAQAMARGSLVEAAHAYIDAAHVAADAKQIDAAKVLIERATLLAQSPLLTAEQKAGLNTRLPS
jgi:tetratricopeptide (TPR) repeat protein